MSWWDEWKHPITIITAALVGVALISLFTLYGSMNDNIAALKNAVKNTEPVTETVVEYVTVPEIVYVERQPIIVITSAERELLARLVYREARGESAECQRAVVSVVVNRMAKNGESVAETIYAKGQFSTAGSLERTTPLEANYEAVDYVLANGSTLPEYVLYFSGGHPHGWAGYQVYAVIDNTYFGFMEGKK